MGSKSLQQERRLNLIIRNSAITDCSKSGGNKTGMHSFKAAIGYSKGLSNTFRFAKLFERIDRSGVQLA